MNKLKRITPKVKGVVLTKEGEAYVFRSVYGDFLVAFDHSAGCRPRYTAWMLNASDPLTIARECTLREIRVLIADYVHVIKNRKNPYFGSKRQALKIQGEVHELRAARMRGEAPDVA